MIDGHQSATDVEFQEQKQSHEIILSWQHIGFCFEAVDVEDAYRDHTRFIAHENLLPVSRVSFLVAVAGVILQRFAAVFVFLAAGSAQLGLWRLGAKKMAELVSPGTALLLVVWILTTPLTTEQAPFGRCPDNVSESAKDTLRLLIAITQTR